MDSQIVAVYCLCDDLLKALCHHEDQQCQMSDAEVMTSAIIAMLFNLSTLLRLEGLNCRFSSNCSQKAKQRINRSVDAVAPGG